MQGHWKFLVIECRKRILAIEGAVGLDLMPGRRHGGRSVGFGVRALNCRISIPGNSAS